MLSTAWKSGLSLPPASLRAVGQHRKDVEERIAVACGTPGRGRNYRRQTGVAALPSRPGRPRQRHRGRHGQKATAAEVVNIFGAASTALSV
jgi:hypothetical protein